MQRSHKHRGWRSLCGPLLLGHRVGRDSISGSSTPRPGLPAAWATRNDPVHTLRMLHSHIRCAVLTSPSRPHIPTHNPGCSVGQHLPLCGLVGSAASAGPSVLCHVPHWNAATTFPNAGLKAAAAQRQSLGSVARMSVPGAAQPPGPSPGYGVGDALHLPSAWCSGLEPRVFVSRKTS